MMKSLIRFAGLMVILTLMVSAATVSAATLPRQQNYAVSVADIPQQEATPEATAEATEAASVREVISEVAANRSAAETDAPSLFSSLLSIIVTAIVAAVVLAAVVAGAFYIGIKLVRRKGD